MSKAASPQARYAKLVSVFLSRRGVSCAASTPGAKKRFGSDALKINGSIFAMLASGDRFVVKLPKTRVSELTEAGEGKPFDPGHGRLMKEWLELSPGSRLKWEELAQEAL